MDDRRYRPRTYNIHVHLCTVRTYLFPLHAPHTHAAVSWGVGSCIYSLFCHVLSDTQLTPVCYISHTRCEYLFAHVCTQYTYQRIYIDIICSHTHAVECVLCLYIFVRSIHVYTRIQWVVWVLYIRIHTGDILLHLIYNIYTHVHASCSPLQRYYARMTTVFDSLLLPMRPCMYYSRHVSGIFAIYSRTVQHIITHTAVFIVHSVSAAVVALYATIRSPIVSYIHVVTTII
jgi:hypothetical protein